MQVLRKKKKKGKTPQKGKGSQKGKSSESANESNAIKDESDQQEGKGKGNLLPNGCIIIYI